MVKFNEARLQKALNQRYLDDIEEIVIHARRLLITANNRELLRTFEEKLETMKDFVKVNITNRNRYLEAKAKADQAKSSFITILIGLDIIETINNTAKVNVTITRVDALEVEQERQKLEIVEIKEKQIRDKEDTNQQINQLRNDNTHLLGIINGTTNIVGDLSHRVTSAEEAIKTIKQDIASIKSQLSAHVEDKIKSNPNQFAKILEREIPKDSPMYNQQEYDQIMAILDGIKDKQSVFHFKNALNESLFKFAPKLVEALIDGYLHRKDFALKYKYLQQKDSVSSLELCKAALSSIGKLNPSSETVGMVLDGVKAAGYGVLMGVGIIDGKITDSRVRKSYVREADRIEGWFEDKLRFEIRTECGCSECKGCSQYYYKFSFKQDIVEKYHSFIWENYKTLNLEEWSKFLKSSVVPKIKDQYQEIPLKEISQKFLYYIAAFEKGQFSEYSLLNGRIVDSYEGYGANLRRALMPRTQKHADEILEKMHSVSVLKLYALYNLSSFAEHCYEVIVNNSIIPLSKIDGQSQESRQIFLENFDKRCLARSSGYCNFETFVILETFMREGAMPIATTSNTIEASDIITETVNAATNTFQNHQKQVTTKAKIENNEINPIVEIGGIEGYDIQRSRINSRT